MKLERMTKTQYYYLSEADSKLYDEYKDVDTPEAREIVQLVLARAADSRAAHCACKY